MNAPQESPAQNDLERFAPRTQEVLKLAMALCREPGVSMPQEEADFPAINRSTNIVRAFAKQHGLKVYEMPATSLTPYPHLTIAFDDDRPLIDKSDVALVGHIDVVKAQSEAQFHPHIDGDMLVARGAADMKTVVATQLVWMAEQQKVPGPKPSVVTMVSTCEENGSTVPNGTQHALAHLREVTGTQIKLAIVGERTGEMEHMFGADGRPLQVGPICEANRGWHWYRAEGDGKKNGMEALKIAGSAVASGRLSLNGGNENPNSDRMRDQSNWRSSFTNSFALIGSDEGVEEINSGLLIRIKIEGESRHSASFKTGETSPLERFYDASQSLMAVAPQTKLVGLKIGEDKNYNSVNGGGEVTFAIESNDPAALTLAIDSVVNQLKFEANCSVTITEITAGDLSLDRISKGQNPVFGIDSREVPEHANDLERWKSLIRAKLAEVGVELEVVNEGPGWECPADNPHYQKLMTAYASVMGEVSAPTGKLHGNDGRFFGGNAVVFGQTGISPHGPNEGHYIPSIIRYLEILDQFAEPA